MVEPLLAGLHAGDPMRLSVDATFPELDAEDTIVFLGDYVDRGPHSAQLIAYLRHGLPKQTRARLVCLRGNHEDAWLKVVAQGWRDGAAKRQRCNWFGRTRGSGPARRTGAPPQL